MRLPIRLLAFPMLAGICLGQQRFAESSKKAQLCAALRPVECSVEAPKNIIARTRGSYPRHKTRAL
jgi:hypothetical protein